MGDKQSKAIVKADILSRQFQQKIKDADAKYQNDQKNLKTKEEKIRRDHDNEMKRLEEKILAKNYQEFVKMRNQNEEYQKKHLALLQKEQAVRLKEQEQALRAEMNELKSEEKIRQNARANEFQQVWTLLPSHILSRIVGLFLTHSVKLDLGIEKSKLFT